MVPGLCSHPSISQSAHQDHGPGRNPDPGKIIDHLGPNLCLVHCPGTQGLSWRSKVACCSLSHVLHSLPGLQMARHCHRAGGDHGTSALHLMPSHNSKDRLPIRPPRLALADSQDPRLTPSWCPRTLQELQEDPRPLHRCPWPRSGIVSVWVFSHNTRFSRSSSYLQYRFWNLNTMPSSHFWT